MDKIKVQLLQVSTEKGDSGTVEYRRDLIQAFLVALQRYLTPEAIESFEIFHLRALQVQWYTVAAIHDLARAEDDMVLFLDIVTDAPRERPPAEPQAENIVNIFAKTR